MQSFLGALFSPSGASSSADADAPSAAPSAPALFDEEEAATVAEMRAAAAAQRELERREVELALADEEADEFGFEDAAHAEARWRAIDEANDAAAADSSTGVDVLLVVSDNAGHGLFATVERVINQVLHARALGLEPYVFLGMPAC